MVKQVSEGLKTVLNERINFITIVKGIIISYLVTIPMFIIFAFILTYTNFPEKYISYVVLITMIMSILIAGSIATRNLKSKGWFNGGFVGLIYIMVLYILSSVVFQNFSIDKNVLSMALIAVITGSIGGIIGINAKKSSHSKYRNIKKQKRS